MADEDVGIQQEIEDKEFCELWILELLTFRDKKRVETTFIEWKVDLGTDLWTLRDFCVLLQFPVRARAVEKVVVDEGSNHPSFVHEQWTPSSDWRLRSF